MRINTAKLNVRDRRDLSAGREGKLPHLDKPPSHASLLGRGRARGRLEPAASLVPFFHLLCALRPPRITQMTCASDNTEAVDQSNFWTDGSIHWDAHRVGWAIAGGCTAAVRVYLSFG